MANPGLKSMKSEYESDLVAHRLDLALMLQERRKSNLPRSQWYPGRRRSEMWEMLASFRSERLMWISFTLMISACACTPSATNTPSAARSSPGRRTMEQRVEFVQTLTDQGELARCAELTGELEVGIAALERLSDDALISRVAANARTTEIRVAALEKLTDKQEILKLASEGEDPLVRSAARKQIADEQFLAEMAIDADSTFTRNEWAVEKLTDQALLTQVALETPHASTAILAVKKIADQTTLVRVALERRFWNVQYAVVERLTDQALLAQIVLKSHHPEVATSALKKITDQALLAEIAIEDFSIDCQRYCVEKLSDQTLLAKVAIEEGVTGISIGGKPVDVSGKLALEKVADQALLRKIVLEAKDWDIRRDAFSRLDDASLAVLASDTTDPVIQLVIRIVNGETYWRPEFLDALQRNRGLGNVLRAAALVDDPVPSIGTVEYVCCEYIRRGDISVVPELTEALMRFGNKTMAEVYLNCGQPNLAAAGRRWARKHGYSVDEGYGSVHIHWGER